MYTASAGDALNTIVSKPNVVLNHIWISTGIINFCNIYTIDGSTLTSTRLEVQAPKIHYVHPTWFEAGKPIELLLCGSSLDQPKFRYGFLFCWNPKEELHLIVCWLELFAVVSLDIEVACLQSNILKFRGMSAAFWGVISYDWCGFTTYSRWNIGFSLFLSTRETPIWLEYY